MPLYPVAPMYPILRRNPPGHGFRKKDRSQCEAVEKGRLLAALFLRFRYCLAQSGRLVRIIEAAKKGQWHTPSDVHSDLAKQARIEVDCRPTRSEPEKFNLEDSEISELST